MFWLTGNRNAPPPPLKGPLASDMFSILHQLKSNFRCRRAVTGEDNRETALRCDHNAGQSRLIIFHLES